MGFSILFQNPFMTFFFMADENITDFQAERKKERISERQPDRKQLSDSLGLST